MFKELAFPEAIVAQIGSLINCLAVIVFILLERLAIERLEDVGSMWWKRV